MNLSDLRNLFAQQLGTSERFLDLDFGARLADRLGSALLVQRAFLSEGIRLPSELRLDCFTTNPRLPVRELIGLPLALRVATPSGPRIIASLVSKVWTGLNDDGLMSLHIVGRDPFHVLAKRRRLFVWNDRSAGHVVDDILHDWIRSPLGNAFAYTWLDDPADMPVRASHVQYRNESDADLVCRLLRSEGWNWAWRTEAPTSSDAPGTVPRQELLLFKDGRTLPDADPLEYHVRHGTQSTDTLDSLSLVYRLVPGSATVSSWDHETARVDSLSQSVVADQGQAGNALAAAISDERVVEPHVADNWDHLDELTRLQADSHRFHAHALQGEGGVRDLVSCTRRVIEGYASLAGQSEDQRRYTVVSTEACFVNNLPADLQEHAQHLRDDSNVPQWARSNLADPTDEPKHWVRFVAVPSDTPIVPSYLPERDDPRPEPLTGIVWTPGGEEVWCDQFGRVQVALTGAAPGSGRLLLRVRSPLAGANHGFSAAPRRDTEVDIDTAGGPHRWVIAGSHYNGHNMPPRVGHQPSLPANRHRTTLLTREIGGTQQQHLLFDDTPGQQMAQLATDVGDSALSLGALTTPRAEGRAQPRGNGFELRTDQAGAIRSGEALLISTWQRLRAMGKVLDADEHQALMKDFADLFTGLGDYAAQHQGLPTDSGPQAALAADIQAGKAPTVSVTAPGGIASTTPKTILSYAGINIDSVAMQHQQYTAGGYYVVNAGKGASIFAHAGGIQTIAHHGMLLMQSQHDDTQIDSAKDLKVTVAKKGVFVAEEFAFMTTGGAYITLKGGKVTIGGSEPLDILTDGHNWGGPATQSGQLPSFGEGDLGRTPKLLSPTDGSPVEGMSLHIGRADGDLAGQTDSAGKGTKIVANGLQRLKNFFFVPRA